MPPTAVPLPTTDLKPTKTERFPVPRTPAGGLAHSMSLDDIYEAKMERDQRDWTPFPGRYYFSKIGSCFRKEWLKEKGTFCNHDRHPDICPECRFDAGKSEPGHAVEFWIEKLMEEVYTKGKGGSVLKDMRISEAIPVPQTDPKDPSTGFIHLVGKTDMLVMGDNFRVLEFMELKTAVFWKQNKTAFAEQYGKSVPLALAGIEEPEVPNGLANVNNALQLAVGVKILRNAGLTVDIASLIYMSRERYRDYVRILLSEKDVDYLHDWSVEWLLRHHENVQSDEAPAPEFMMGYECRNCPFSNQCNEIAQERGETRHISPMMVGLNARLAEANGAEHIVRAAPAKKQRKPRAGTEKELGRVPGIGPGSAMDQD